MQSLEGVVPGGDEGAVNPQFAGDFEVVQRVPHEENLGGSDGEAPDECVAEASLLWAWMLGSPAMWSKCAARPKCWTISCSVSCR